MLVNTLKQFIRKTTFLSNVIAILFAATLLTSVDAMAGDDIDIDRASWSSNSDRLTVSGDNAPDDGIVSIRYSEKEDNGAVIGAIQADGDGDWEFRIA